MRLGILGGSFNPVHYGPLFLADIAICSLKLDRVIMIPANKSPFKLDTVDVESAPCRLEMLASAIAGDPRLALDDCEIKREGVSYTVDTLEDIISRYMPDGKPVLIIGDDVAGDLLKWHDSEKLLKLADIAIARRYNSKEKVNYPFPYTLINNEVMNISSKAVRQKIKDGTDWRSLVPHGAVNIIEDRRLYGYSNGAAAAEDCTRSIIRRMELAVRESLTTDRFLHSRNTALMAYDLCRRFNLNPLAGYLAGITHDIAKQIDNKLMMKLAKTDERPITDLEKDRPNLLHGRAGAVLLKERFCINNKDILEAVAFHTSGSENMGPLAKVIYIADKTEVSRNIDSALREMCMEGDLDSILFAVVKKTVSKLESRKLDLSEDTLRLLNRMKGKN
jgi:nicotinate-nucleotide adenylyltransferase